MSFRKFSLAACLVVLAHSSCQLSDLPPGAGPGVAPPRPAAATDTLYARLGGYQAITSVVTDFVTRAAGDPRINGYFLNANVLPERVIGCLVIQVGALTGGPYTYPSQGCRDMKSVHTGMKVSQVDFDNTAEHLVAALNAARVSQADIATIVTAVAGTASDIVEDRNNNATVYQRAGRKPGVDNVVLAFMRDVYNDTRINGFFAGGDPARLRTCLTRMVCGIDGPCKYGAEVDGEAGVAKNKPCKDMLSLHRDINQPRPITKQDFDALVEVLVGVLDRGGVAAGDKAAILGALGPMCKDIVAGATGC